MINRLLVRVIKQTGLTAKHATVWEKLLLKPKSTPLQLSRETKLNRSSLYRYLEDLRTKGLVELVLGEKSSQYKANPEGLNQYLASEEARVESLKTTVPSLVSELTRNKAIPGSEVKYYQGLEGLKQMLWNVVSANVEFVGLGYEDWNTSVGKRFAEKLRAKNLETKVGSREILNALGKNFEFTDLGKNYGNIFKYRLINPKILEIKHDTYIYGDVFAYYYHYQGEYFGVEIHNVEIARTERQIFEIVWKMAKRS